MSTEQEKELEPDLDPMEDTDRIQRAIEKVVDEETAALPPLPLSGISDEPEDEEPYSEEDGEPYEAEDASLYQPKNTSPYPSGKTGRVSAGNNPADTRVHTWFFTFMCMNIPIVGWIYLLYLAFSKKRTERRNFARAYLFYKLIFLLVSALILGILVYIGLGYLDQLLAYMEML